LVIIEVPKNFLSDGNSGFAVVPEFGWFSCEDAWIIHDWLYASHPTLNGVSISQEMADKIMLAILDHRDHDAERFVTSIAMRLAPGQFSASWKTSGEREPEYIVL